MQSSHYDNIRPPKFSENFGLNSKRLTRDRERVRRSRASLGTSGKISEARAKSKSIEHVRVNGTIAEMLGVTPDEAHTIAGDSVLPRQHSTMSQQNSTRTTLTKSGQRDHSSNRSLLKRNFIKRISTRRFESAENHPDSQRQSCCDENVPLDTTRPPKFLTGKSRLDGNWGALFDDGKSTYMNPDDITQIDHDGFASIQGGHTPILFLQELAHLSSLLNAVAMSTLRNDVEGVSSPLSLYIPGSHWPAVDPKLEQDLYDSPLEGWCYAFLFFLGQGRSPQERARYNVARPLPVLGGVSDGEIQQLQIARGPLAKTQLCFGWLSEFANREYEETGHGALLSRCMQFLSDGMLSYNDCRKIMFNPFPL